MELRHLRYFIAVAEEGHVTRAAERLGMQQPPLSQRIRALERELDVQLFHRKARGIQLTDAGRAFLINARGVLAQLDRTIETTKRTARGEEGKICVGIVPASALHPFVPQAIREFREAYPLVTLQMEERLGEELIEMLRNEQIDAAFTRTRISSAEGLAINPLLEEPLVVAVPSTHAIASDGGTSKRALPLKSLASETFIFYRSIGAGLRELAMAACWEAGFTPRVGQEAPRVMSALSLVAVGLGVSLVPASLQQTHMDGVVYRHISGSVQPTAPLDLATRRNDPSAVVQHFSAMVKQAAIRFRSTGHKGKNQSRKQ